MSVDPQVVYMTIERETGRFVGANTKLQELNVDSLEFVDLLLAIANETGLSVPDDKVGDLQTVGDIVAELA